MALSFKRKAHRGPNEDYTRMNLRAGARKKAGVVIYNMDMQRRRREFGGARHCLESVLSVLLR